MFIREFLETHTIEIHQNLNPRLWGQNQKLLPEVREKLLKIAKDFAEYVDVPFRVVDVIVAGSNASLTYTKHSDLDLHLIADYASLGPCDREAEELFDTKRHLYKKTYDIKIHNVPVELYVEDQKFPAVSNSYSVLNNQWIKPPTVSVFDFDQGDLLHWTQLWTRLIRVAIKTKNLSACKQVLKLLRDYRKQGLTTDQGEFSIPNLVYKNIRNRGILADLSELIDDLHSKSLSIK
jgi:hypothetical protein